MSLWFCDPFFEATPKKRTNSVIENYLVMDKEKNKYFYKYRSINENELSTDRALNALFGSYSVFSSRILFNDIFDSKINFNRPTTPELNLIRREALKINKKKYKILCECVNKEIVTDRGERFLKEHEVVLNQMIDKYCFFVYLQNARVI